ncbi:MAG: pyridoxal-phosphate dependent enzyme, partial [Flavobacteriales bacterium TMED191]
MDYVEHITELIGNTPLVKLNKIVKNTKGIFLAKLESFNPGHSIKDRIGGKMIEDAEKNNLLKPGGTIIESTSGNTGMGLALSAIRKGYKMIVTMPDKMSSEKIDILRAIGVEVIITPTNVKPEDIKSYYSVAKNLQKKIKNSFYIN